MLRSDKIGLSGANSNGFRAELAANFTGSDSGLKAFTLRNESNSLFNEISYWADHYVIGDLTGKNWSPATHGF